MAIAFTYRRDGKIVNCKYRDAQKHFWQENHGEKMPYGLDDIKEARDIIIVEGEFDKLSMEEVGYRNCISVPDGAPTKVSTKELPPVEQLNPEEVIFCTLACLGAAISYSLKLALAYYYHLLNSREVFNSSALFENYSYAIALEC